MHKYYLDYSWNCGKPVGKMPLQGPLDDTVIGYRIVADPYHKRISIEKCKGRTLVEIIYDSILMDFRHLKPAEQYAWSKETLQEEEEMTLSLIRNQEDRAIYYEKCLFKHGLCVECRITSTHHVPLSVHRMCYESFGDPFNGVILYDMNAHPVMFKIYSIDSETKTFTELLREEWTLPDSYPASHKLIG